MVKSVLTIIAGLFTWVPKIIGYFKNKARLRKLKKINEIDINSKSDDLDKLL